ncbi:MAG: MmgE/PrpD family protein [Clostridia bacterium]|nr:MmgE/PrpD family protein [Clostridia bacterium]
MNFKTDYKLESFVLNIGWDKLSEEVKERMRGCFIDLMGAMLVGSKSEQFEVGLRLARSVYGKGDIAVIGTDERFNFMGASCAMGHSSNAYDIDDGHNMTRAHPGTSFVGGVLAAAYEKDITLGEFLSAMLASYEVTVRMGAAIMDYYNYAHSSGTFGAVGVVTGVGKIYGFTKEELNNALSVAEFNAPLVPGIRSVEYPSMNKDGVPFGVLVGALAVMDSMCGFMGNKNLLEADEYRHYLDDLGEKYQVMDLYFKPYPCCRWAHPAIDACIGLLNDYGISWDDIECATVKTFKRATLLSKIEPKCADEAQYNIAYPVATALVYGSFGIEHVFEKSLTDPKILDMMKKLSFEVDADLDAKFPAKRICKVEIRTKDGRIFTSPECEPRGEAHEGIGFDWLADKFRRITAPVLTKEGQESLIAMISGSPDTRIRDIVDEANRIEYRK